MADKPRSAKDIRGAPLSHGGTAEPDSAPELEPKPKRTYKTKHKIAAEVLDLHARDLSIADISRAMELPRPQVRSIIDKFKPVLDGLPHVNEYRTRKADIIDAAAIAVLESAFSGRKLEKAGFLSTLQGFEILNKAGRLEANLSTDNVAHRFTGRLELSTSLPDPDQPSQPADTITHNGEPE